MFSSESSVLLLVSDESGELLSAFFDEAAEDEFSELSSAGLSGADTEEPVLTDPLTVVATDASEAGPSFVLTTDKLTISTIISMNAAAPAAMIYPFFIVISLISRYLIYVC